MRPIHLSVAGLHSFREQQEVDFQSLCEGGVFGIFGPTGSGKSSLLDAITLALYGKVERASNNTQGILNHAEDQIFVSFTFELRNAKGATQYRVERSFKRTGEINLKTAICRLLKLDSERVVLADKTGEVNQQIQLLLGLTLDDFTRAVVLPQGKFAEFLSLKGTERRQMLQRLFHLEQYGDNLNHTLRTRIGQTNGVLAEVTAEQQGLGDASKEALLQARDRIQIAKETMDKLEFKQKDAQAVYEKHKKIWDWQQELEGVEQKIHKLAECQEEFKQKDKLLLRSEEASRIKHYVDQWDQANRAVHEWATESKQLTHEVVEYRKDEAIHARRYQSAVKEREEQQPYWLERQSQLKQAKELQTEIKQLGEDQSNLQSTMQTSRKQVEQQRDQADQYKVKLNQLEDTQRKLLQELESTTVSIEHRERVHLANTEYTRIKGWEQQLEILNRDYAVKKADKQKAEDVLVALGETSVSFHQQAESLLLDLIDQIQTTASTEQRLVQVMEFANAMQETCQTDIEHLKGKNLARQLAHQLKSGQPCPVCGSKEHPTPIHHDEDDNLGIENASQRYLKLGEAIKQGLEMKQKAKSSIQILQQIYHDVTDGFSDVDVIAQLTEKTKSQVAAGIESTNSPLTETVEFEESDIFIEFEQLFIDIKNLTLKVHRTEATSRQITKAYRQQLTQHGEAAVSLRSLDKECREKESKVTQQDQEIDQLKRQWKTNYPEFEEELIFAEQNNIGILDRKAKELKERLDQNKPDIEAIGKNMDSLTEKIRLLEMDLVRLEADSKYISKQLSEKQQLFTNVTGNDDAVEKLLQQAIDKLTVMKQQEQQATALWEQKRQALQQKENQASVAEASLNQAQSNLQRASNQWAQIRMESIFSTMEQVKEALMGKDEQRELKREIDHYRDQEKQWQQELVRLNSLLSGSRLTRENWQISQELLQEIQIKWNEALMEHGAAAHALQDIELKHHRYNELETRGAEASQLLEKLGQLQQVFRGNSFVEYIAEEQLIQICRDASHRLAKLTRQRYALEVDSSGGFIIRDDANGGVKRPVSTLSGGETFLTSLALALSLSTQIQLQGEYPLEFFFLDEGFGTLDSELLDTVLTTLENLHTDCLSVGVISHVPELRARLPRRLIVHPAEPSGRGSLVKLETL